MGKPAAKKNDNVFALDTHITMVPSPLGSVPTPMPYPFNGVIDGALSKDVRINKRAAATVGSTATNKPSHQAWTGSFSKQPSNKGKVTKGSKKVFINKKAAARLNDASLTCNDPKDLERGRVIAVGNVFIGG